MKIRPVTIKDAKNVIAMTQQIFGETQFMLLEADEWTTTVQLQSERLATFKQSSSKVMFIIEAADGELLGFANGTGNTNRRNKHSMYCVMGIKQSATRQGLGYKLLQHLQLWAAAYDMTRLELTVMCHNMPAKRLYDKFGFQVEGVKRQSLRIDDGKGNKKYVDEFMMSKLLD